LRFSSAPFNYAKVTLQLAQRIRGAGSDPGLWLVAIKFAGEVGELFEVLGETLIGDAANR